MNQSIVNHFLIENFDNYVEYSCSFFQDTYWKCYFKDINAFNSSLENLYSLKSYASLVLLVLCFSFSTVASAQVVLNPHNPVYFIGSKAVFACNAENADNVSWYFNGKLQGSNDTDFSMLIGVSILRINSISLWFNGTKVQCEADFAGAKLRSDVSTILLQGIVDSVSDLRYFIIPCETVNITWTAPFSLPVSDYERVMTFCVDIYNLSSSILVYSQCNINETYHITKLSSDLIACALFSINVTAENFVGNSTAANIIALSAGFDEVNISRTSMSVSWTEFEITMECDFCPYFTTVMDDGTIIDDAEIFKNIIKVALKNNQHYNLTLGLFTPTYNDSEILGLISTYDVQSMEVSVLANNSVQLKSSFSPESLALGVLYVLMYYENDEIDCLRSLYFPIKKEEAEVGVIQGGISGGSYIVVTYDIEYNGCLQSYGLPSNKQHIFINQSLKNVNDESYANQSCSITVLEFEIKLLCFCETNNYQVLLQRRDTGKENFKIMSAKGNCSIPEYFAVEREGIYCITVFKDDNNGSILSTSVYFSAEFMVMALNHSILKSSTFVSTITSSPTPENIGTLLIGVLLPTSIVVVVLVCVLVIIAFWRSHCRPSLKQQSELVQNANEDRDELVQTLEDVSTSQSSQEIEMSSAV